jgi:antitoxin MazE
MRVSKWGNSLAVRLPAEVVTEMGLKAGDEVEVARDGLGRFGLRRKLTREEAIERLRSFRGAIPAGFKFNREEANER